MAHGIREDRISMQSTEEIRSAFPALERVHNGCRVAYFDGPGGTHVPRVVVDAMADYLYRHNANTHWAFPSSIETDAILLEARGVLAEFLNASPTEISFGANMTTATFHLARALGRRWGPGDAVVVTELDHHANIDSWRALERDRGITILQVRMLPETGELDWADLDRCLHDDRTRLVAIGAASNALGTINDVGRAVAMAREASAMSFIDAVHFAPHELIDVEAWGCDFLACSAYKFHGPHVGVLFARRELAEAIEVAKLQPAPENGPERFETGTQNHEGIVGAAAAVEYLASLARASGRDRALSRRDRLRFVFESFRERGSILLKQLWDGLSALDGVKIFGPPPDSHRTPTLSFTVRGMPAEQVSRQLADRGIFASHGDFYATTVARRLGVGATGFVRLGCACYTTNDEVERVIAAMRAIARGNG